MTHLWIDFTVVLIYLVGITIYGVSVGRRETKTQEGYFLGGRKFGWFTIGASIYASNISATVFMSASGLAHSVGVAAVNNDLMGVLMLSLSAVYFIPLYVRSRLCTMTEFLERRYCRTSKLIYSYTYLLQGALSMPTGFYIGGIAVLSLFKIGPEHLPLTCLLVGGLMGLYSVLGGLTSIVKTEVVQAGLLIGGGLTVALIGLHRAGGWAELYQEFGPTHFRLLLPRGTAMPWTALPGIAIATAFFAFCNVGILQRALGAKSVQHAQAGLLFSAFLKFLGLPLFALPGIVAAKLYPHSIGDSTYALLIRDLLPVGLSGLVMAGLLAALMSAAESGIGAMSSIVAYDIYPSWSRSTNERTGILIGKWTAGLLIAFAVVVAPYAQYLGPIYLFILRLGSFTFMPIGVVMIIGRFSRRVNHQGALWSMGAGVVMGFAYVLFTSLPGLQATLPGWFVSLHFYEVLPFFCFFCVTVLFGISYATPPPPPDKLAILEAIHATDAETRAKQPPLFRRFNLWLTVCLVLLGAVYIAL